MKTNSLPLRRRKQRMETLLKLVETEAVVVVEVEIEGVVETEVVVETEAEEGVVDEAEQLVMEAALSVESRATCPGSVARVEGRVVISVGRRATSAGSALRAGQTNALTVRKKDISLENVQSLELPEVEDVVEVEVVVETEDVVEVEVVVETEDVGV